MSNRKIIIVYRAPSMIERDALLNELKENEVEALAEERDMSRKVTNSTIDLALSDYSVMAGGFPIYVLERDEKKAVRVIKDFLEIIHANRTVEVPAHLRKFYACSIFTILFPVIFHVLGFYNLYKGIKAGEKIKPVPFAASTLLYFFTGTLGAVVIRSWIL